MLQVRYYAAIHHQHHVNISEHIRQLGLSNGIHVLQQVFGWLGFSQADTKNRTWCTTAEKIWREIAHSFLSIAIYQPCIHLLFGAVPFGRRVVVAQKVFLDSRFALIRQQQPQAGNALVNFVPVWICVFHRSLRYHHPYDLRKIADTWISFCFVNEFRSQAWFGSKIRSLFLPSMLDCFFKWLQQHEHCSWAFFRPGQWKVTLVCTDVPFPLRPRCWSCTEETSDWICTSVYLLYIWYKWYNDVYVFYVLIDWRLPLVVKIESSLYEYKKPILRGKTPAHLPVCRCSEGAFWGADGTHGERKVDLSLAIWSAYSIQDSLVKVLTDLRFMIALVWE